MNPPKPQDSLGPAGDAEAERWAKFVATRKWTFARTYVSTYPHEWTSAPPGTDAEFMWAVEYVRQAGRSEKFWGYSRPYLYFGPHKYWSMGSPVNETTVLNRCFPRSVDYSPRVAPAQVTARQVEVWEELARLAPRLPWSRRKGVEAACRGYLEDETGELPTRDQFPEKAPDRPIVPAPLPTG